MPSLAELTMLFNALPEVPPPMPRVRQKPLSTGGENSQKSATAKKVRFETSDIEGKVTTASTASSFTSWLLSWLLPQQTIKPPVKITPERRPHPMAAIKQGRKVAIIAVVDAGSPSFFRFGQGEFSDWPMVG